MECWKKIPVSGRQQFSTQDHIKPEVNLNLHDDAHISVKIFFVSHEVLIINSITFQNVSSRSKTSSIESSFKMPPYVFPVKDIYLIVNVDDSQKYHCKMTQTFFFLIFF